MRFLRRFLLVFASLGAAASQRFYVYIQDLGPDYVELGWGTADGVNTIGRSSPSHGEAVVSIAGRTVTSESNQVKIAGLEPDHDYQYEVSIGKNRIGTGEFRTWAAQSDKLAFFVVGDYGSGAKPEYQIAEAMSREFDRRAKTGNPVRFLLSVGDNIYGNVANVLFGFGQTGANDRDWAKKYFDPYESLLKRIPFFGTLGNHDGNETEMPRDLPTYLDNFPFPGGKPGRYYSFTYGGLAKLYGLDSTKNTESGPPRPNYLPDSAQFQWMKEEFVKPHPPWVIPYFHHPPFSGGPLHSASLHDLQHWVDLFAASGVKVVFNGHEHNFQVSEADSATEGIRFIVSGAGGELRAGNIEPGMKHAHIAMWAGQHHFLAVEIEGKTMKITPLSYEPVQAHDADGKLAAFPLIVTLP